MKSLSEKMIFQLRPDRWVGVRHTKTQGTSDLGKRSSLSLWAWGSNELVWYGSKGHWAYEGACGDGEVKMHTWTHHLIGLDSKLYGYNNG